LNRLLSDFAKSDVIEARIIDEKGTILATSDANLLTEVGKKSDYWLLNRFKTEERGNYESPDW